MNTLKIAVSVGWILFWAYWLVSARAAKQGIGVGRGIPRRAGIAVALILLLRVLHDGALAVHSTVLETIGAVIFASGIALAVWARVNLGRNWGMPMTRKPEPELITSGPYRLIRHPIYTGILTALLGTVLVTNLIGLILVAIVGVYFYRSASVEEQNLTETFSTAYPAYRERTKMLVPYLL
jgi:protein-S-isoprenylcysteine O-methyltransferase Ste14